MPTMSNALEEYDRCEDSPRQIRALLVMSVHSAPLLKALESCHIDLLVAQDCKEAGSLLETEPSVQILFTDRTLRDRDWFGTMELMAQIPGHVQLIIICCGLNDHRRMIDALELGAYDVLFPPYEPEEIQRIVEAAAAKSERRSRHHAELSKLYTFWSTSYEAAGTL
jgi:DNA-binding NtrC family response regulator